jgi:hypothetical protein
MNYENTGQAFACKKSPNKSLVARTKVDASVRRTLTSQFS